MRKCFLMMQVKDTKLNSTSTGSNTGGSGEDSHGSSFWPTHGKWVQLLCYASFKASVFSVMVSYAILTMPDQVYGQWLVDSLPYQCLRSGSYFGLYIAIFTAWMATDVAMSLPKTYLGWTFDSVRTMAACSLVAVAGITSPY